VATPPQVRRMSTQRYQEALDVIRANHGVHPKSSAFTRDHDVEWDEHNVLTEYEQGGATAVFAQLLGLTEGDPVLYRKLLKQVRGETVQLQTSVMPLEQVAGTPVADPHRQPWPGGTIAELFSLGCVVTRVTEEVQVRQPTAEERKRLNLIAEGPVMEVTRVFFTADGPVECSLAVVEATAYRLWFETELT